MFRIESPKKFKSMFLNLRVFYFSLILFNISIASGLILDSLEFKVITLYDDNFCYNTRPDFIEKGRYLYRNSDTLTIIITTIEESVCFPKPVYDMNFLLSGDSLYLEYIRVGGGTCIDTTEELYLEYKFRILSDTVLYINIGAPILLPGVYVGDSLINTKEIKDIFVCRTELSSINHFDENDQKFISPFALIQSPKGVRISLKLMNQDFSNFKIYVSNAKGSQIKTLSIDNDTIYWDETNNQGIPVPNGTYFFVLKNKKIKIGSTRFVLRR